MILHGQYRFIFLISKIMPPFITYRPPRSLPNPRRRQIITPRWRGLMNLTTRWTKTHCPSSMTPDQLGRINYWCPYHLNPYHPNPFTQETFLITQHHLHSPYHAGTHTLFQKQKTSLRQTLIRCSPRYQTSICASRHPMISYPLWMHCDERCLRWNCYARNAQIIHLVSVVSMSFPDMWTLGIQSKKRCFSVRTCDRKTQSWNIQKCH